MRECTTDHRVCVSNTGARLCDISFFRPRGPMGYFLLGDFAERSHLPFPLTYNFEAPPASRVRTSTDTLRPHSRSLAAAVLASWFWCARNP